jgi:hypothetical protein
LGYARHRDELIERRPSVWAELDDETKCFVMFMCDEDIEQLTLAAIDVLLQDYDETVGSEMP